MTEEREKIPLVTFALFAYNQEKYIREAVEGALAQDYPNLEIIISDDASGDATWQFIQESVADYSGSHKIKLNRNSRNLGVTSHVNEVVSLSSGRLIVMAAGDDISVPSRVTRLFEAWREKGFPSGLVHSTAQPIDEQGTNILKPMQGEVVGLDKVSLQFFRDNRHRMLICGATPAYTRDLFEYFGPLMDGGLVEDAVLTFRAILRGQLIFVNEPLVSYRISSTSISGAVYSVRKPEQWLRWMTVQELKIRNHISDYALHIRESAASPDPNFVDYLSSTADGFAVARKMVSSSWIDRLIGIAKLPGPRAIRAKFRFALRFYA
ncbi:glycosyltransferase [Luteimonas sp. MJ204]|uniref:glycosyltransferase n=1 Tax=Luteimonas sp. MJ145 TaxID=3129234 RepID=UPI0031B9D56C